MSTAVLPDAEIDGTTELDTLFEESIPCAEPEHGSASHSVEHPTRCRAFFCSMCIMELERFLRRITEHLKECPEPRTHTLVCTICNQQFHPSELSIKPLR
jgi:hypothetical protein